MPLPAAHPERVTLLDFAAGLLDDAGSEAVERHLRRCTACRALVAAAPTPSSVADAAAAVEPTPEDAVAAAELTASPSTSLGNSILDELVTRPIAPDDAPTLVQPAAATKRRTRRVRSAIRTRRVVAAVLAILIVILLAVAAWFVTTDEWRDSEASSGSDGSTSVRFETSQV